MPLPPKKSVLYPPRSMGLLHFLCYFTMEYQNTSCGLPIVTHRPTIANKVTIFNLTSPWYITYTDIATDVKLSRSVYWQNNLRRNKLFLLLLNILYSCEHLHYIFIFFKNYTGEKVIQNSNCCRHISLCILLQFRKVKLINTFTKCYYIKFVLTLFI